ncbi:MAG: right-handed parallel beta-helix repeat-containing protein [Candidatus Hodarchaeales archaeon]
MKKIRSLMLCTIPFSFFLIGLSLVGSFSTSVHSPPSSGDWLITGSETLTGEWSLNGSIVINSTGSLTINNAKIVFAGVANGTLIDGEWNITVLAGGSLTIQNSEITSDGSAYLWYLRAMKGSSLSILNCNFSRGGVFPYALLEIETSDVSIAGSHIISSSYWAITGDNTTNLAITDTEIFVNATSGAVNLDQMYNSVITRCNLISDFGKTLVRIHDSFCLT